MTRSLLAFMLVACAQARSVEPAPAERKPAVAPPTSVEALQRLGERYLARLPPAAPDENAESLDIAAIGPCKRPSEAERTAIQKRLLVWVNRTTAATEKPETDDSMLGVRFGCVEAAGIVVDVQADRRTKQSSRGAGSYDVGHWWTLRVTASAVGVLAHASGDAMVNSMEWSWIHTARTLVLADLDRDGVLDPVTVDSQHEGGSQSRFITLAVTGSRTNKPTTVATFSDAVAVARFQGTGTLVVDITEREGDRHRFRCIDGKPALTVCPDSIAARHRDSGIAAAERLKLLAATPDREDLEELLAAIDVPVAERAPLLAGAAPPTAGLRTARRVLRFAHPADERTTGERHAEAERVAQVEHAAILGDLGATACTVISDDPAVTAWIRASARAATAIAITGRCGGTRGAYFAATWQVGEKRHEAVFFGDRGKLAPASAVAHEPMIDPNTNGEEMMELSTWFYRRGDVTIAIVIARKTPDGPAVLSAIVDGKPVASRQGQFSTYAIAEWTTGVLVTEQSADGVTHYWHATAGELVEVAAFASPSLQTTPTGSPLARRLVTVAQRRIARDLLDSFDPTWLAVADRRHDTLRALALTGADRALLEEVAAVR